jgi:serpin B
MRYLPWLCLFSSVLTVSVCSAQDIPFPVNEEQKAPEIIAPEVPENVGASIDQEKIDVLVKGNNLFALRLYGQLRSSNGNLVFSPYSISSALGMLYAGAAGSTAEQMKKVLNFSLHQPDQEAAFYWLTKYLTAYTSDFGPNFRLLIENSLWVQNGQPLLPEFQKTMSDYFRTNIKQVDFISRSDATRNTINRWVADHTQGRITTILQPNDLASSTRLVLVSAFYMKARWNQVFDASRTQKAPFFPAPSKTILVSMMETTASFPFYQDENVLVVELPYAPPKRDFLQLAMLVMLPAKGLDLDDLEKKLSGDQLQKWRTQMVEQRVNVILPKFTSTAAFSLNDSLQNMGMKDAFTNGADFSRITGTTDLSIGKVLHKAFISVDENGTEAAAATAVTMNRTSMPSQPVVFRADRPFVYIVVEKSTGAILLMGRLSTP